MKWFLIIGGILVFLILIIMVVGKLLPVKHKAKVTGEFRSGRQDLWKAIRNFSAYTEWRTSISELTVIDDLSWVERDNKGDKITFGITEENSDEKMVVKILDKDLPFGGEWVYEIKEGKDFMVLAVTENGEIYNPIFRFVSHFFMDKTATLNKYMQDLQKHLTS